jgi:hypothetical protein
MFRGQTIPHWFLKNGLTTLPWLRTIDIMYMHIVQLSLFHSTTALTSLGHVVIDDSFGGLLLARPLSSITSLSLKFDRVPAERIMSWLTNMNKTHGLLFPSLEHLSISGFFGDNQCLSQLTQLTTLKSLSVQALDVRFPITVALLTQLEKLELSNFYLPAAPSHLTTRLVASIGPLTGLRRFSLHSPNANYALATIATAIALACKDATQLVDLVLSHSFYFPFDLRPLSTISHRLTALHVEHRNCRWPITLDRMPPLPHLRLLGGNLFEKVCSAYPNAMHVPTNLT